MVEMSMENNAQENSEIRILKSIWLEDIPSYANKLYYSLGFLSMISFMLLFATGVVLVFFGPHWWFTTQIGVFVRSVHLWAVQAFVVFIIVHALIVFVTGAYRPPRRFLWVLGALMLFLALMEAEFGYVLR
ncbi:MAG: cytochrome b N-terminal domain-containing protein, partial [Candidatus Paceibacterales bacterium]